MKNETSHKSGPFTDFSRIAYGSQQHDFSIKPYVDYLELNKNNLPFFKRIRLMIKMREIIKIYQAKMKALDVRTQVFLIEHDFILSKHLNKMQIEELKNEISHENFIKILCKILPYQAINEFRNNGIEICQDDYSNERSRNKGKFYQRIYFLSTPM